jgi:DNA-binding winged helix-turn-helix (wHTH) protein
MKSLIKNDLWYYGINLDFEFDIVDIKQGANKQSNSSVYFSDDLGTALLQSGYELRIKFPKKRAIMNRMKFGPNNGNNNSIAKIGKFEFDSLNQLLIFGKKPRRLTLKESRILRLLSNSKNNLVKREEIMLDVWGESDYYTGRSLDVFISKLRSYLKDDNEVCITTIPTVGYILEVKDEN